MTKFNFQRGGGTKKGALHTIRGITPQHTIWPIYFDEKGKARPNEEVKNLLAILRGEKMANCRSCNHEIYFCKTSQGKPIPVNSESLSEEEKQKIKNGDEVTFIYGHHIAHFATCKDASKFRKPKK